MRSPWNKVQLLSTVVTVLLTARAASAVEPNAKELFERRLMPIFKSPNPSSCVQCHLAGVDLKDYILPDHEKTFRSLRDQGLIDVADPDNSKILRLIRMGAGEKGDAVQVSATAREAELAAFKAWIVACSADPVLKAAPKLDGKDRATPIRPVDVIRHARKDQMLESFERNVWSLRFRCMNCHTEGTPQCDKHVKEHGEQVAWFKQAGPAATMDYLLSSKLIDDKEPEKSLLLRKPLGDSKHGGGVKFHIGDQGYKSMRTWIEDIAAIRGNRYARAADLPAKEGDLRHIGTDIWLKLTDTPAEWADRLLQVSVFAWDGDMQAWETQPMATSDRLVFGKGKLWQHNLTLLATPDSVRSRAWSKARPTLPVGRYLLKVHVDRTGRLTKDWREFLGGGDFVGQAEMETAWRPGYGAMSVVNATQVKP